MINVLFDNYFFHSPNKFHYEGIICSPEGKWSKPPVCEELNCKPPPAVENAHVAIEKRPGISEVTYTCLKGYKLLGQKKHVCFGNNEWDING